MRIAVLTDIHANREAFEAVLADIAPLALAGDKLEAKGSFKVGAGTKVLADVALNGKPAVAARFTLK